MKALKFSPPRFPGAGQCHLRGAAPTHCAWHRTQGPLRITWPAWSSHLPGLNDLQTKSPSCVTLPRSCWGWLVTNCCRGLGLSYRQAYQTLGENSPSDLLLCTSAYVVILGFSSQRSHELIFPSSVSSLLFRSAWEHQGLLPLTLNCSVLIAGSRVQELR